MGDKKVLSYHDCLVYESDTELLNGRNWLNDTLISFWFEFLRHESFPQCSSLLFVSPEVTQLIKMGDARELPAFLDPLEARFRTHIFLPVNDNSSLLSAGGSHWSLLAYSKYDRKWFHYDSQRGSNHPEARRIVERINKYLDENVPAVLHEVTDCTQQDNSYDCGAFAMVYAERLATRAVKGLDIASCFMGKEEASKMRETIASLIESLK